MERMNNDEFMKLVVTSWNIKRIHEWAERQLVGLNFGFCANIEALS